MDDFTVLKSQRLHPPQIPIPCCCTEGVLVLSKQEHVFGSWVGVWWPEDFYMETLDKDTLLQFYLQLKRKGWSSAIPCDSANTCSVF